MLHEVLLALLGYTGDLIIDDRDHRSSLGLRLSPVSDDPPSFKVAPDISFLHPSERFSSDISTLGNGGKSASILLTLAGPLILLFVAVNKCRDLIERIVSLGFYYRELDRFATKSRNLSWIRSADASPFATISESSDGKTGVKRQSVYRRAIANGIVEILSVYRSAVLHIEQKLLSETVPILATLTQGLNKVRFRDIAFFFFNICFV